MLDPVVPPRIVVLGLGLPLYEQTLPQLTPVLHEQLERYITPLHAHATVVQHTLCTSESQVEAALQQAQDERVDAVLAIAMCYTASLMSAPALAKSDLPLLLWNTQDTHEIPASYDFITLLHNHTAQGTQDLASVLVRRGRTFGLESGHHQDAAAVGRLGQWFDAARATRASRQMRVGRMGQPFDGMGDFIGEDRLASACGASTVELDIPQFIALTAQADRKVIDEMRLADEEQFEVAPGIDTTMFDRSLRGQWALQQLIEQQGLGAFTMNFLDLIGSGRCDCLPLYGINKLMAQGLGYAGEGDVATAALMATLRQLVGQANFTEIYTLDYPRRRMMMTHMQECNPALARRDQRVKLVPKTFWSQGGGDYVGMHFCLEPGPVTLVNWTLDADDRMRCLAYETQVLDHEPYPQFDIPHWVVQLDEPVEEFLTRYSMAGGTHHLASVPGHHAESIRKMSHLQNIAYTSLKGRS